MTLLIGSPVGITGMLNKYGANLSVTQCSGCNKKDFNSITAKITHISETRPIYDIAAKFDDIFINCPNAIAFVIELFAGNAKANIYVYSKCLTKHDLKYMRTTLKSDKCGDFLKIKKVKVNREVIKLITRAISCESVSDKPSSEFILPIEGTTCITYTSQPPVPLINTKKITELYDFIKSEIKSLSKIDNTDDPYEFINNCFKDYKPTSKKLVLLCGPATLLTTTTDHLTMSFKSAPSFIKYVKNVMKCDLHINYLIPSLANDKHITGASAIKLFNKTADIIILNVRSPLESFTKHMLDSIEYSSTRLNKGGKIIFITHFLTDTAQLQILNVLCGLFKRVILDTCFVRNGVPTMTMTCLGFNGKKYKSSTCKDSVIKSSHIAHLYPQKVSAIVLSKISSFYKKVEVQYKAYAKCLDIFENDPLNSLYITYMNVKRYQILKININDYTIGGQQTNMINLVKTDMARVILIPFANFHEEQGRDKQLEQFFNHMTTLGNKLPIIVVEQMEPKKFNKGYIYNMGVRWIIENTNYKTIILHDVDILPDSEMYEQYISPDVLSPIQLIPMTPYFEQVYGGKFNIPVGGGVTMITVDDYVKVDGFPLNFWNWGGEDNAFQKRLKKAEIYYHYNNMGDFITTDLQRTDASSKEKYLKIKNIVPNKIQKSNPHGSGGMRDMKAKFLSVDNKTYTHIKIKF